MGETKSRGGRGGRVRRGEDGIYIYIEREREIIKKTVFSLLLGALQGAQIGPRGALQGAPRDLFFYIVL